MSKAFVFLLMVFFHIIDDFVLQAPTLCNLKQKRYWDENAPDKMYKYDYICALFVHGFSWSFMMMLPLAIYKGFAIDDYFVFYLIIQMGIHAFVDHTKANDKIINLWSDQLIHFAQIVVTAILFL